MKTRGWIIFGIISIGVALEAGSAVAPHRPLEVPFTEAESLYAKGAYSRALEIYEAVEAGDFEREELRRWVEFRRVDSSWRAAASTRQPDRSPFEEARRKLEEMNRGRDSAWERDYVWAEVEKSLGDLLGTTRYSQNGEAAWPHWRNTLDWWAGCSEVEKARKRYVDLVLEIFAGGRVYPSWRGVRSDPETRKVVGRAREVARDNGKRVRLGLIELGWIFEGRVSERELLRAPLLFERILGESRGTPYRDEALYRYGEFLFRWGVAEYTGKGELNWRPDFPKALEMYRELIRDYAPGESAFRDEAERKIRTITQPQLELATDHVFLPESLIRVNLHWRNVDRVDFKLHAVELPRDVEMPARKDRPSDWLDQVDLAGKPAVRSWTWETGDTGSHQPGNHLVEVTKPLEASAYILEAAAGGMTDRMLLLVSDAAVTLKTSGTEVLVYFCEARRGTPLPHAPVTLWLQQRVDRRTYWHRLRAETNADGIAVLSLDTPALRPPEAGSVWLQRILAFVGAAGRQCMVEHWHQRPMDHREGPRTWKIHVSADRPVYRPGDSVHWKWLARVEEEEGYVLPHQPLYYELIGPRGDSMREGEVDWNDFGSAWGTWEIGSDWALGQYQVRFREKKDGRYVGNAVIFRLEEYRLPEFRVTIKVPESNGRRRIFRLGEEVELEFLVEYYFGGPVAGADAEVEVTQRRFVFHGGTELLPIQPRRRLSGASFSRTWPQPGQVIINTNLVTDAHGLGRLRFSPPDEEGTGYEYEVSVRVTDVARRQVTARESVRVTEHAYAVQAESPRRVFRPKEVVEVQFHARDANENPVAVGGTVTLVRKRWREIWLNPRGREVTGTELARLKSSGQIFPPPPESGLRPGWVLKSEGYESETIRTEAVTTGEDGDVELSFTPSEPGYYCAEWFSLDSPIVPGAPEMPIRAETCVWVTDSETMDLGYHHQGVEVIVDRESLDIGAKVPIMLATEVNDRYVLFSVESDSLHDFQVVHIPGTVKLMRFEVEENHAPNVFLTALMVDGFKAFQDLVEVKVPPSRQALDIEVSLDQESYQPGEPASISVQASDHTGYPVAAEIAVGVVDAAVYAIQPDYAPDLLDFYFGTKRQHLVQTSGIFDRWSFVEWWRAEDGKWRDRLHPETEESEVAGGTSGMRERYGLTDVQLTSASARSLNLNFAGEFAAGGGGAKGLPARGAELEIPEAESAVVRRNFAATAFWQPNVVTDATGRAQVSLTMPDSLTEWKATACAVGRGNRFGSGEAVTRTRKPVMLRLETPRFFVAGDRGTISTIANNETGTPVNGNVYLKLSGPVAGEPRQRTVEIPAHGEARLDWPVAVSEAGSMEIQAGIQSGDVGEDHLIRTLPVVEHGIEKFVGNGGMSRREVIRLAVDLPAARRRESTQLIVQATPSLAVTMLDALPFLIDYPYGCTEQTMSRFLPTVIVADTLAGLGLSREAVLGKAFGGIDPRFLDQTHPEGSKELGKLDAMTRAGLERLAEFQHSDGGWGWWKEDPSDPFMTAYVVWGLALAREAEIPGIHPALDQGLRYLQQEMVELQSRPDLAAFALHALSFARRSESTPPPAAAADAFRRLWDIHPQLNAYARALLALSGHYLGYRDEAVTLAVNLENGVLRNESQGESPLLGDAARMTVEGGDTGTAHWGGTGLFFRWSEGAVETTAFALRALLTIDPEHPLIEPAVRWLLQNRRGAQWNNTRDTAISLLALTDYLKQRKELENEMEFDIRVNGRPIARPALKPRDVLTAPSQFPVDPEILRDGNNEVVIRRVQGSGPIYFSGLVRYFSREEPITPAGNQLYVHRGYRRVVTRPTLLEGYVEDREPLPEKAATATGTWIESVLLLEAKNAVEYVILEDFKPAGLEAADPLSGPGPIVRRLTPAAVQRRLNGRPPWNPDPEDYSGPQIATYKETREQKSALFLRRLDEGFWEIRFRLRAESPGRFHGMPAIISAMYIPDLQGNSREWQLEIAEKTQPASD